MASWNPLDWIGSTQDWFTRTERSSGFRPYLIFLMLVFGLAVVLLTFFRSVPEVLAAAVLMLKVAAGGFVVLFAIKAFQEPEFCRSETHIQKMRKMELESRGTESEVLEAEVVEAQLIRDSVPDEATPRLRAGKDEEEA